MQSTMNRSAEFRYCEIPNGENVLALLGSPWIREYGVDDKGGINRTSHFHNLLEIGICRWGRGTLVFDHETLEYEEGCVTIIPKNVPHNTINQPGEKSFWEYIYLKPGELLKTMDEVRSRDVRNYVEQIELRPIYKKAGEIPLFVSELNCLMDQLRMQGYGYRKCVNGLIYTLLMEIVKINHEDHALNRITHSVNRDKLAKLEKALDFVEEHYPEDIRIGDMARAAYISETYLRRLFADQYHMSPLQYVNLIRVEAACKLLEQGSYTIYEVAHKVGFENMSTFIKNFKRILGETPKQWMRSTKDHRRTAEYMGNAQSLRQ